MGWIEFDSIQSVKDTSIHVHGKEGPFHLTPYRRGPLRFSNFLFLRIAWNLWVYLVFSMFSTVLIHGEYSKTLFDTFLSSRFYHNTACHRRFHSSYLEPQRYFTVHFQRTFLPRITYIALKYNASLHGVVRVNIHAILQSRIAEST